MRDEVVSGRRVQVPKTMTDQDYAGAQSIVLSSVSFSQ